jgi:allantoicase
LTTEPLSAFLIGYSNSGFTNPHEVVWPEPAADCRMQFTHMGAKYSGFETDRHRATACLEEGFRYDHDAHHWLHIGLKQRAVIDRLCISTRWFTGNQVRAVSVTLVDELSGQSHRVLERQPLQPDADHEFPVAGLTATECRVECYYEGGIARIHLFGTLATEQLPSRTNLLEGARISHVSNDHYGNPAMAVAGNRREHHMVGWESARTGFGERALFHLEKPAVVQEIVVDTYLHRLNPPLSCHVCGLCEEDERQVVELMSRAPRWKLVLPGGREVIPDDFQAYMLGQRYLEEGVRQFDVRLHRPETRWLPLLNWGRLEPDRYHRFLSLSCSQAITHLLYMHYPNGGIHGLKALG